ncbi:unnamed protein product, partial [Brassica oleracea]
MYVPRASATACLIGKKIYKLVYAVDDEGQDFSYSPSNCLFWTSGKTDSKPGHRSDWLIGVSLVNYILFCRGTRGGILWCDPDDGFDWEEVKGLEDFQDSFCGSIQPWGLAKTKVQYDINKLCTDPAGNIVIFWNNPDSLELWSAVISLKSCNGGGEIKGILNGPVLSSNLILSQSRHIALMFYILLMLM